MKKLILTLTALFILATASFAVPNIQLYIPGATFDTSTDTWVFGGTGDFELWVLAGNLSATDIIYDLTISAALRPSANTASGYLNITPAGGGTTTTYSGDYDATTNPTGFQWGTPPPVDPLPSHGIYPTNYIEHHVAAQTSTNSADWVDVYDMPTGGGPTDGQIFKFNISTTYGYVHFDAYGFTTKRNGTTKRDFAPFSHDAESVPEPATMLLFGLGLAGAGIVRRFKK